MTMTKIILVQKHLKNFFEGNKRVEFNLYLQGVVRYDIPQK